MPPHTHQLTYTNTQQLSPTPSISLTEFGDSAHPGGQQALLHGAELGLTEGRPLPALRRSLLLSVQSQALRQAEHTWGRRQTGVTPEPRCSKQPMANRRVSSANIQTEDTFYSILGKNKACRLHDTTGSWKKAVIIPLCCIGHRLFER